MNREEAQKALNERFELINSKTDSMHSDMIAQARSAYAKRWGHSMSAAKEAVLKQSLGKFQETLEGKGMSRQQIASAVGDVANVNNPISMMYNLMSILIPNFAWTEVVGVQPMPTKKSPIFYPQITANTARNGISVGDKLLGTTNWAKKNTYSTNKNIGTATVSTTSVSFTAPQANMLKNTVVVRYQSATASEVLIDDGNGHLNATGAYTSGIFASGATVTYSTGVVTASLNAADATAVITVEYRYEWTNEGLVNGSKQDPSQIIVGFDTKDVVANPYRLRSLYDLDNLYAAKQVLGGYDIDGVLNTALGGLINKEISCNVFDEMEARADATYAWSSTAPTGVDPSMYNLSIVQELVKASNGIRDNIQRCGGNYIVSGINLMNILESLPANYFNNGNVWSPEKFADEPIGPYVAGNLLGKFKVLKNQDFAADTAIMGYKKDDVDCSYAGGVYIGLYNTTPLAKDDLTVVQGCGTQMGTTKLVENSLVRVVVA